MTKALLATQRSTASLGKFYKMRDGGSQRKKAETKALLRKRKLVGVFGTNQSQQLCEKELSLNLYKATSKKTVRY